MKRVPIILTFTAVGLLLFANLALAIPTAYEFLNAGTTTVGAVVYAEKVGPADADGFYSYWYQVENRAFDPTNDGTPDVISSFVLPIATPVRISDTVTADGTGDVLNITDLPWQDATAGAGYEAGDVAISEVDFRLNFPAFGFPSTLEFFFDGNIAVGEFSNRFWIMGGEDGLIPATLNDNGGSSSANTISALIGPDGGAGTGKVPEPTTLLLVGFGLLSLAGWHRSRKRN